jgi:hypothetical protein
VVIRSWKLVQDALADFHVQLAQKPHQTKPWGFTREPWCSDASLSLQLLQRITQRLILTGFRGVQPEHGRLNFLETWAPVIKPLKTLSYYNFDQGNGVSTRAACSSLLPAAMTEPSLTLPGGLFLCGVKTQCSALWVASLAMTDALTFIDRRQPPHQHHDAHIDRTS